MAAEVEEEEEEEVVVEVMLMVAGGHSPEHADAGQPVQGAPT